MDKTPQAQAQPSAEIPRLHRITQTVRTLDVPELRREVRPMPMRLYRVTSKVTKRQVGLSLGISPDDALERLLERDAATDARLAEQLLTDRYATLRNHRAFCFVDPASPREAAEFLALHITSLGDDDYLAGHPEWQIMVDLARQANPKEVRS